MFRNHYSTVSGVALLAALLSASAIDAHGARSSGNTSTHTFEAGYITGDPSGSSLGSGPMLAYFYDFGLGPKWSIGVGTGFGRAHAPSTATPALKRTVWIAPVLGRIKWSLLRWRTTPFVEVGAGLYYTHDTRDEITFDERRSWRPGVSAAAGIAHRVTKTLTLGAKASIHSVRPDAGIDSVSNEFGIGVYQLELRWRR